MKKIKNKLGIILMSILCSMILTTTTSNTTHAASVTTFPTSLIDPLSLSDSVTPPSKNYTPTVNPVKILGIYLTSGFTKQPEAQYAFVGQTKTIYTNYTISLISAMTLVVPPIGVGFSPIYPYGRANHFVWWTYDSNGNAKWTKVGQDSSSLTQTFTKEGMNYYQVQGTYYNKKTSILQLFTDLLASTITNAYSAYGSVFVLPAPVDATSLHVYADNSYLMNNVTDNNSSAEADTTTVHADPTPTNATGTITYKSSNTDLATVDPNTGLVTATTDTSKSGTVRITATMQNYNLDGNPSNTISDYTDIEVGGGLDDQTVTEGKSATFKLRSFSNDSGTTTGAQYEVTSADWYRIEPNSSSSNAGKLVSSGVSPSYTTGLTNYDKDNGALYYLKIKIHQDEYTLDGQNVPAQDFQIVTNKAKLNVQHDTTPNVTLIDKIKNNSYSDSTDTDDTINNVKEGDVVTYTINAKDSNKNTSIKNGALQLEVPTGSTVNYVDIDGIMTTDYTLTDNLLTISNINLADTLDHKITVDTTTGPTGNSSSFTTTPKFVSPNNDFSASGNALTIKYGSDSLRLTAANFGYGAINNSGSETLVNRTNDTTFFDALTVEDNRRDKTPLDLSITATPLTNGTNILPATLRYYFDESNFKPLGTAPQLILSTTNNQALGNISWTKNDGIKLHIQNGNQYIGTFKSKLTWTVTDSVTGS